MRKKQNSEVLHKKISIMKRHLFFLFIIFISTLILLGARVSYINRTQSDEYKKNVLTQHLNKQTNSDEIAPKRGSIFDRNGIVLAESIKVYNVIYDPGVLNQHEQDTIQSTNEFLSARIDDVKIQQLESLLQDKPNSHYEIIAKGLDYNDVASIDESIKQNAIKGVFLEGYYKRVYPYDTMADDVLGFVNASMGGTYGVEEYYEEQLRGTYGRIFGYFDEENIVNQEEIPAEDGKNIELTIDYNIQRQAEFAIDQFLEEYDAKGVHIISMDPSNGEVLAMASYPKFNLNEPYDLSYSLSEEELDSMSKESINEERYKIWKNGLVSDSYEPGSTFKPFVLAAALEEGTVSLEDTFDCEGYKVLYGHTIRCWKDGGHGVQNPIEALANSCNVSFMEIGDGMGKDIFYEYQTRFGFGSKTNIDLLGEEDGLLNTYDGLGPVELATASFGQGFNVTPLQLISGFSSLINGGYLYEPYIMKSIMGVGGKNIENREPTVIRQVISEETSTTVTLALEKVVSEGTGHKAGIEGYHIGGKTGTAEKGARDLDNYIVSFIGFTPIYDPQIVTLVIIDEPDVEEAESGLAATVFADMMDDVLPYYHIYPESQVIDDSDLIVEQ